MMKIDGRIISLLLAVLTVCALMPFSAAAAFAADTNMVSVNFVVFNDFTGMTFDPVLVEEGQLPDASLPKLPQYVTDANGQNYKSAGWHTDPACTKPYVPAPVSESFTLYAKYVKQYLLMLYTVDTSGNELPFPAFDAYIRSPGLHGGWFDEGADVTLLSASQDGFRFVEWRYADHAQPLREICESGELLSRSASETITMRGSMYCVAVFGECVSHTPGEAVKEKEILPSCEKDGSFDSVTRCAACHKELRRETITVPALGHDFGTWTQTALPGCLDIGEETRTCARCSTTETRTIDPLGHAFDAWTQTAAPTCTDKGSRTRACSRCGAVETEAVDALGHAWDAWEIVSPAVPGKQGKKKRVCSRCGETQTAVIGELILHTSANGQSGSNLNVTVPYTRHGAVALTLSSDEDVFFTSSDPKLLQVDENGSVTFTHMRVLRKRAVIAAVSADGSKTAVCTVTIRLRWWQYILWFLLGFLWY